MHLQISVTAGILLYLLSVAETVKPNAEETDPAYWIRIAQDELARALNRQPIVGRAKNVILFVGDGMGVSTVTAARIYQGQRNNRSGEEGLLYFERFPNLGLTKVYNMDKQTPDSAGTATGFLTGVKSNYGTIGVDASVTRGNCSAQAGHELTTILDWSLQAGKQVGIVTTTRITHATPAAAYAHAADRGWEGDDTVEKGCKDIARQLVEDNPHIQVILGGGRRYFQPDLTKDPETGDTDNGRLDGRDLIQEWLQEKRSRKMTAQYVWNASSFYDVDVLNTDYLLGLFESNHMQYDILRTPFPIAEEGEAGEPSLAEMVQKAVRMLQKHDQGFFLLVEGGRIDHGHHANRAKLSLADVLAFEQAVRVAAEMTSQEETLIVVTADHSHVFNIAGYPSRGNSITGEEDRSLAHDGLPYTTLLYANGPGYAINLGNTTGREDITTVDVEDVYYRQQAAVPLSSETHSGEDVAVYARGPMGHLFHATHEQNYIAFVLAYASCVGIYANERDCAAALMPTSTVPTQTASTMTSMAPTLTSTLVENTTDSGVLRNKTSALTPNMTSFENSTYEVTRENPTENVASSHGTVTSLHDVPTEDITSSSTRFVSSRTNYHGCSSNGNSLSSYFSLQFVLCAVFAVHQVCYKFMQFEH